MQIWCKCQCKGKGKVKGKFSKCGTYGTVIEAIEGANQLDLNSNQIDSKQDVSDPSVLVHGSCRRVDHRRLSSLCNLNGESCPCRPHTLRLRLAAQLHGRGRGLLLLLLQQGRWRSGGQGHQLGWRCCAGTRACRWHGSLSSLRVRLVL